MVRPIEGEPTYQRLLREPVIEEDQWSSDPSKKRLFLLHQASTTFSRFIQLIERDVTALPQNTAAYLRSGGSIAGGARKKLEKRLGRSIVSNKNYLPRKLKTKS